MSKDPETKEGKVLYVDVKDAITTTTYRIPYETKAKTYTLTAVFSDIVYDWKEADVELVIAKA